MMPYNDDAAYYDVINMFDVINNYPQTVTN